MRVNVAVPESYVSRPVLDAALEATTRLNEAMLKDGKVPLFRKAVNRVRWRPEPPGDEHFDHAGVVLGRGWGDCDDLAPWHAASLRATGEDPGAKAFVKRSGEKRWHAVVQRSDGSVDDPSREAGMGQRSTGVKAAGLPLMVSGASEVGSYIARPQLALRPVVDSSGQVEAWQSRADLPWHWVPGKSPTDVAMVSLHASPTSSQAVVGAIEGLLDIGEANDVPDDVLDRAAAVGAMCSGYDYDDVADEYGDDMAMAASNIVGSFFGGLLKKAVHIANPFNLTKHIPGVGPMVSKFMPTTENILKYGPGAASFIPGIGPAAGAAAQAASPMLQQLLLSQGGGGRPSPVQTAAFDMAHPLLQQLLSQGGHLPPYQAAPSRRAYGFGGMPYDGMHYGG